MNADRIVETALSLVNTRLLEFFKSLHTELLNEVPKASDLATVVQDYTMRGGKRLRAILALVGYWSKEWMSGDREVISDVMAAIELLQSYLLIHDDVMDRDELRRGGPTVHILFTKRCVEEGLCDCEHYGISQAIVAGDLLEASAAGLLASRRLEYPVLRDLLSTYAKGLRKVAYGQYLDVLFSLLPLKQIREDDVLQVYKLKTSSYTIELPLHLGAIASGKYSDGLLKELTNYAIPAGIAFQIRDDIIGLYGDPSVTGKPAGSDVRGKKKTILIIKAHELADAGRKRILEEVYERLGKHKVSDYHVEEVRDIVKETGALQYAEKLIEKYVNEAKEALKSSKEICREASSFLEWIAHKLSYRDK